MAKFQLTGQLKQITWADFCAGVQNTDAQKRSSCPFAANDTIELVRNSDGTIMCNAQEYTLDGVRSENLNYTVRVKNQNGVEFNATLGLFKSVSVVDAMGEIHELTGALPQRRNEDRTNASVCTYLGAKPATQRWRVARLYYVGRWENRTYPASALFLPLGLLRRPIGVRICSQM